MKLTKIFLSIICFSIIFNACREPEEVEPTNNTANDPDTSFLAAEMNAYFYKAGSYWVYENPANGNLDSTYVTNTTRSFGYYHPTVPNSQTVTVEYYQIDITSSMDAGLQNNLIVGDRIMRNGTSQQINGQMMILLSAQIGSNISDCTLLDTSLTITIGNTTFDNVSRTHIVPSQTIVNGINNETYLYFKGYLGIIKKEIDMGGGQFETWNLIRWNVIF